MVDIARLGIAIDSAQAVRGASDLDKFTSAAGQAEAAASKLAVGSARAMGDVEKAAAVATRSNDNLRRSLGLQADGWKNLGFQVNDAVTMLASGSSAFQVLATQGGQTLQVLQGANGGVGAALRSIGAAALGTAGGLTAAAAVMGLATKAAYDFSQSETEVERATFGIGKASGATMASITRMSDEIAGAAKVSVGSAREMMTAFARSGKVNQDLFSELTVVTSRYAKGTGVELPEAAAKMAAAFSDPAKGALELTKELGFLNAATLAAIEKQAAFGDRTGAQRTLLDAMKNTIKDVSQEQNAWTAAIELTIRKAKEYYDLTGRSVMKTIAPTDQQQLSAMIEQRDQLRGRVEDGNWFTSLFNGDAERQIKTLEEQIVDMQERIRRRSAQTGADARRVAENDLSLRGKSIVDQFTPNHTEILLLQTYKSTLEELTKIGQGTTQTESTLKRINGLLAAGGQAARDALRDAKTAADQAGMLPVPRARAQAEEQFRRQIEAANGDPSLIANAEKIRAENMRLLGTQTGGNVVRDYKMRVDELNDSLRVQRDSFGQSAEVAETMRARLDMMTEATRNGQSVAERYGAGWEALAAQMGKARAATEDLHRAQRNAVEGMDELRSGSRSSITGIFSDIRQGRDPTQALMNSVGRMQDQMFDRLVSRPLVEGAMGFDGKAGGGLFGDFMSKAFGTGMQTANMSVQAASVVINGGVGGMAGGGAGLGAVPGGSVAAAAAAPAGQGGVLGALTAPFAAAKKIVTDGAGRVLSFGRAPAAGSDSGGLPIEVKPSGAAWPVSPVSSSPIADLSVQAGTRSGIEALSELRRANPLIALPPARLRLEEQVRARDYERFGDSGVARPDLVAGMGPELLKRRDARASSSDTQFPQVAQQATQSLQNLSTQADATGGAFGKMISSIGSDLVKGGTSLFGQFGISGAQAASTGAVPGFADGTDFAPGGVADVGERGRERVFLPRGSKVVPNHKLDSLYTPVPVPMPVIMPQPIMQAASPAPIINITTPPGFKAETTESIDGRGGRRVDVTMNEVVAGGMKSRQGRAAAAQNRRLATF